MFTALLDRFGSAAERLIARWDDGEAPVISLPHPGHRITRENRRARIEAAIKEAGHYLERTAARK